MRIDWKEDAKADARAVLEHIAQNDLAAAYRMYEEIGRQAASLAEHPGLGRAGRVRGTRELLIATTPYIAVYRIAGDAVRILRILHGAQRWPQGVPGD